MLNLKTKTMTTLGIIIAMSGNIFGLIIMLYALQHKNKVVNKAKG